MSNTQSSTKERVGEIFVKHGLPTRQLAISELVELFSLALEEERKRLAGEIRKKANEFDRLYQGHGNGRNYDYTEDDGRVLITYHDKSCTIPDFAKELLESATQLIEQSHE